MDDDAIVALFQEMYRRILLAYKEVCEASLGDHLSRLGMYRALPMRWQVFVTKTNEGRALSADAEWQPVNEWEDCGADVHFGPNPSPRNNGSELVSILQRLGRDAGSHLLVRSSNFDVRFDHSKAYRAVAGESVVLVEVSAWVAQDLRALFGSLPRSD